MIFFMVFIMIYSTQMKLACHPKTLLKIGANLLNLSALSGNCLAPNYQRVWGIIRGVNAEGFLMLKVSGTGKNHSYIVLTSRL